LSDARRSLDHRQMSTEYDVRFTDDAAEFLAEVGDLLAAEPVTATVVTTVAARLSSADGPADAPYSWFAVVDGPGGEVTGVAMRTAPFEPYPPYLLGMPDAAATALAEAVLARGEDLGGVNGALPSVDVFARAVAARAGGEVSVAMHTRLFELGELVTPRAVEGRLRAVRPDEAELALDWIQRFFVDADEQAGRAPGDGHTEHFTLADVERKLAEEVLWFWVDEDDVPVHLTGANPPAYGVARVGPVFTPKELRGRGYGSAAVAEVSRRLRDAGHRVTLFTDQANPTSNKIYLDLGYEAVEDQANLLIG
jgi:GNAT superfamily N-acetyltransferase